MEQIKGKTFKEIDIQHILENTEKGSILTKIIDNYFKSQPTFLAFKDALESFDVELKICAYVRRKNGVFAKERLPLSIIDYHEMAHATFDFNQFIFRHQKLVILWYEYDVSKKEMILLLLIFKFMIWYRIFKY